MTATPHITEVTVVERDNPDYGQSWNTAGPREIVVTPMWSDVDRDQGTGYVVGNARVADRLRRAMLAGVVFTDAEIKTDVNGKTYVSARSHVLGRMINADLRRLGF
jgi:hypothetical protein